MTILWSNTERGFRLGRFTDRYDNLCEIQESSLASENCIWLGLAATSSASRRMHLTRDMARELGKILRKFANTGDLP